MSLIFHKRLSLLSVTELNELLKETEITDEIIRKLSMDSRAGVKVIAKRLVSRKERSEILREKEEALISFEKKLYAQGKKFVAGTDEAGRGPLAGPVVSAAVIFGDEEPIRGLDDSKKLTAEKREKLYEIITAKALAWGIGIVESDVIDDLGILKASLKSMRIACKNMKIVPDVVLVDGNQSPGMKCEEHLIVDGDAKCRSIAAASVIAKVTRDRIMVEMDKVFPGYGFAKHKGYGSQEHIGYLQNKGPCPIHRFSFQIVCTCSPAGAVSEILKNRFENARTKEDFENAAAFIQKIKESLHKKDIEKLRNVYKNCKKQFEPI
jgi:ribonuclease HII